MKEPSMIGLLSAFALLLSPTTAQSTDSPFLPIPPSQSVSRDLEPPLSENTLLQFRSNPQQNNPSITSFRQAIITPIQHRLISPDRIPDLPPRPFAATNQPFVSTQSFQSSAQFNEQLSSRGSVPPSLMQSPLFSSSSLNSGFQKNAAAQSGVRVTADGTQFSTSNPAPAEDLLPPFSNRASIPAQLSSFVLSQTPVSSDRFGNIRSPQNFLITASNINQLNNLIPNLDPPAIELLPPRAFGRSFNTFAAVGQTNKIIQEERAGNSEMKHLPANSVAAINPLPNVSQPPKIEMSPPVINSAPLPHQAISANAGFVNTKTIPAQPSPQIRSQPPPRTFIPAISFQSNNTATSQQSSQFSSEPPINPINVGRTITSQSNAQPFFSAKASPAITSIIGNPSIQLPSRNREDSSGSSQSATQNVSPENALSSLSPAVQSQSSSLPQLANSAPLVFSPANPDTPSPAPVNSAPNRLQPNPQTSPENPQPEVESPSTLPTDLVPPTGSLFTTSFYSNSTIAETAQSPHGQQFNQPGLKKPTANPPAPPQHPSPSSETQSLKTQTGTTLRGTDIQTEKVQPVVQEARTDTKDMSPPKDEIFISPFSAPIVLDLQPPLPDDSSQQSDSIHNDQQRVSININKPIADAISNQQVTSQRSSVETAPNLPTMISPSQSTSFAPGGFTMSQSSKVNIPETPIPIKTFPEVSNETSSLFTSSLKKITPPSPPAEGFVIFDTQQKKTSNQSASLNVTIIRPGATGIIKPPTSTPAEVRVSQDQLKTPFNLFIPQEQQGSIFPGVSTLRPNQTTEYDPLKPRKINLPSFNISSSSQSLPTTLSTDQFFGLKKTNASFQTSGLPTLSSPNQDIIPPVTSTGSIGIDVNFNPFLPRLDDREASVLQSNASRSPNTTFGTTHGLGTACPKLELQHKGHRAPQIPGNLILAPGFYPIDDPANRTKRCDDERVIDGRKLNWWQILLNNGGEPSTLNASSGSEDNIPLLKNPCVRPFEIEGVPIYYNHTNSDIQSYYREEVAYHRFPETPHTFLESRGLIVWKQSKDLHDSTAYLVKYTRDDSGFWLQINKVECQFNKIAEPNIQCSSAPECICTEDGRKTCSGTVPVLTKNFRIKT